MLYSAACRHLFWCFRCMMLSQSESNGKLSHCWHVFWCIWSVMHNLRQRANGVIHYNILAFRSDFLVKQPVTCTGGVQATALPCTDIHWCFLLRCHVDKNVCQLRVWLCDVDSRNVSCSVLSHQQICGGSWSALYDYHNDIWFGSVITNNELSAGHTFTPTKLGWD